MPTTLTCIGTPRWATPQTYIGNVVVWPALRLVMMKSSKDSEKRQQRGAQDAREDQREGDPPERLPRRGVEVHRRLLEVVVHARQPGADGDDHERQAEHDVRDQDRPEAELAREARRATNSASSEEPITISGAAIGRKISRFIDDRPAKSWRTSANAASVPRIVEHRVASSPISMLRPQRRAHARVLAGVQPVVQGEPVELVDQPAGRVVEAHQDDHEDRDERVDEHQEPEDQDEVLAEPASQAAPRSRPGARRTAPSRR